MEWFNLLISIYAIADELEKVEESTPTYKGVIPEEFAIIHAVPSNTIVHVVIPEELVENLIGLRAQYASMLVEISRELKKLTKEDQEMLIFFPVYCHCGHR